MSSSAASAPPPQQTPPPPYGFSSAFDSGNGELVSATADVLTVRMTEEPFTEADGRRHFQWFHFRVTGNRGNNLAIVIANAGESSYPDGWDGYKAFISADRKTWTRVQETSYDGAALTIRLSPTPSDCVHLAYFVPYAHEKHLDLVARACASAAPGPIVTHETLGLTLDGRAIDALRFGEPGVWTPEPRAAGLSPADAAAVVASTASAPAWERDGGVKRNVWIIARQHPGESMASWWMEGFVGRLLDPEDAVAKKALRRAVVRVVPCVNPDGAARGYLRVNASGANLNREWETPSLERSPEVYHVRNAMDATGPVDLMLDVHGDEAEARSPHTEGTPGWDDRRAGVQSEFKRAYARACPDFQCVFPLEYGSAPAGNVVTAKTQVSARFDCVGMTLEMPFKDNVQLAGENGWTAKRSEALGAAAVDALLHVLPTLRPE
ncbi:uncharacterized protein MICPUCDRAFT_60806 [Micromonas pusilla CCMP1545]|uniref:Predicted protein n=1 Tax=Micromonas pusilla (strain CCMP1545) TaxID=564608 RepID=C1MZP7_MICPC|nr:uncharacterized protein MICPUCDRAFT_60806 [Micromonas pusilla CCMP1545]EEH54907.1 predicted protein [Micromonas pusilla CCMP1545]|eukprot:XP_003061257.1 predicted protein [Micromonas pusilla CCMP1545]